MKIENTTDYSQFEMLLGNRPINQKKVDKIVDDINNGFNMLPYFPILVKEQESGKLGIIDGQHRYTVSKESGLPVYYIVGNDVSLKQIAQLNSRGEKWKPQDYLNCYIKLGSEDYEILDKVLKRHKVPINTAISLLMYNTVKTGGNSDLIEKFRAGEFKVNYEKEANELLELVDDLFGRYVFASDRNLIAAVQRLLEGGKCDFEILKSKIGMAPMMMDKQADVKKYIYNIEQVYNFRNQNRQVIY